jgi:hypothetical protein
MTFESLIIFCLSGILVIFFGYVAFRLWSAAVVNSIKEFINWKKREEK